MHCLAASSLAFRLLALRLPPSPTRMPSGSRRGGVLAIAAVMRGKTSAKFYAVRQGRQPGIYLTWADCEAQVKSFPKSDHKSFKTREEAEAYLHGHEAPNASRKRPSPTDSSPPRPRPVWATTHTSGLSSPTRRRLRTDFRDADGSGFGVFPGNCHAVSSSPSPGRFEFATMAAADCVEEDGEEGKVGVQDVRVDVGHGQGLACGLSAHGTVVGREWVSTDAAAAVKVKVQAEEDEGPVLTRCRGPPLVQQQAELRPKLEHEEIKVQEEESIKKEALEARREGAVTQEREDGVSTSTGAVGARRGAGVMQECEMKGELGIIGLQHEPTAAEEGAGLWQQQQQQQQHQQQQQASERPCLDSASAELRECVLHGKQDSVFLDSQTEEKEAKQTTVVLEKKKKKSTQRLKKEAEADACEEKQRSAAETTASKKKRRLKQDSTLEQEEDVKEDVWQTTDNAKEDADLHDRHSPGLEETRPQQTAAAVSTAGACKQVEQNLVFDRWVPCDLQSALASDLRCMIDPRMEYRMEFDGASKGNPGCAGAGAVLRDSSGREMLSVCEGVGRATCNHAEYRSLIAGLKVAHSLGIRRLRVQGDSKLVVMQTQLLWKVRKEELRPLATEAQTLMQLFDRVSIVHVLREYNAKADELSNIAIHFQGGGVKWMVSSIWRQRVQR